MFRYELVFFVNYHRNVAAIEIVASPIELVVRNRRMMGSLLKIKRATIHPHLNCLTDDRIEGFLCCKEIS